MNVFYFNAYGGNFGDAIGPEIIKKLVKSKVKTIDGNAIAEKNNQKKGTRKIRRLLSRLRRPLFIAEGSILHFAQKNDVIWGTGANPYWHRPIPKLDIRAVRGPLTRRYISENSDNICPEFFGSPAILVPDLFPELKKSTIEGKITIIPHYWDLSNPELEDFRQFNIVAANNDWQLVLNEIVSSELVISSSLHGIILAESFGVPARFWNSRSTERSVTEGTFKYEDYYLGTGRNCERFPETISAAISMGGKEPIPEIDRQREQLIAAFPFEKFLCQSCLFLPFLWK